MAPITNRYSSRMATRVSPSRRRAASGPPGEDIRKQLQRLVRIQAGEHWIVSCYLKLEPRDRSRGKYQIKLKNRVREVVEALPAEGLTRQEMDEVKADLDQILEFVRDPAELPAARGIAVFACGALGLFAAIPVPRVYRSRLLVARTALIRELAAIEDEVGRLIAAFVDKTGATLYEVTAFEAREIESIPSSHAGRGHRFHPDRHGAPGVGEYRYHSRLRHERDQLFAEVAGRIFDLDRKEPVRGVVLASSANEADSLRKFLHPYLAGKVMGTIRANRKGAPSDVHRLVLDAREVFERKLERHQVAEMLLGQGSGWSLNGIAPTLDALSKGQVRTLLIRADATVPGFRCGVTGRLTLNARDCRGLGNAIPVPDIIDDAIEEALRQRIDLDVVFEPDAAETINGLAALLRFR